MAFLNPADRAFLTEQGYLRVPGVIPVEDCRAVAAALYEFLELDPANPEGWYHCPWCKASTGGFLAICHHPALWAIRQNPRLYGAFIELIGRHDLHVSLDRASFKPPERAEFPDSIGKPFIHLDLDLPKARGALGGQFLQGVIYLTDTTPDQGGFHCVPGFNRILRDWLAASSDPPSTQPPDYHAVTPTPIPGQAGDLVVWDHFLPHGSGRNLSTRPRLAQYVFMFPAVDTDAAERESRIRRWRVNVPTFGGDPRNLEEKRSQPTPLTPLGRRLLGLDSW